MSRKVDWEAIKLDKYRANYLGNSLYGLSDKEKKSAMWYLKEKDTDLNEQHKLQIKLEEEIAMRAALGLPVPQIRREKKALEENDLTTLLGRDDNTQLVNSGERIVGAGKGPVRQLDVVAEKLVNDQQEQPISTGVRKNVVYLTLEEPEEIVKPIPPKEDKKDKQSTTNHSSSHHHHQHDNSKESSHHHHHRHRHHHRHHSRSRSRNYSRSNSK